MLRPSLWAELVGRVDDGKDVDAEVEHPEDLRRGTPTTGPTAYS